jgi:hypothetical protein
MTSSTPEPVSPARRLLTRRNLIASTGVAAAAVSAAPLLGWNAAQAAVSPDCPPGTTAPVPPAAKGPAIPASGYLVEEIADRVYWLTDGLYQMIFVTTGKGVVAVDAPPTIGNKISRAIATVTPLTRHPRHRRGLGRQRRRPQLDRPARRRRRLHPVQCLPAR